jgi:glycosyltransferase involved in cell wall biosynthesis
MKIVKSLTIATPFFNEEESLNNFFYVLKKIDKLISKKIEIKYLFIDDGSTDSTQKKLKEFKDNNPDMKIKIHCHNKNYGYGRTIKNSIKFCDTSYLVTYDADCTYDFHHIETLLNKIITKKYDIINVSYKLSNKKIQANLFRQFLSWGGSTLYKFVFPEVKNYNVDVFTCSFRIYDHEKIKDIYLDSDDFNCTAEIIIKSMKKKLKIIEIPGENIGRKYGNSKMNILKNIYNTFRTIYLIKKNDLI